MVKNNIIYASKFNLEILHDRIGTIVNGVNNRFNLLTVMYVFCGLQSKFAVSRNTIEYKVISKVSPKSLFSNSYPKLQWM